MERFHCVSYHCMFSRYRKFRINAPSTYKAPIVFSQFLDYTYNKNSILSCDLCATIVLRLIIYKRITACVHRVTYCTWLIITYVCTEDNEVSKRKMLHVHVFYSPGSTTVSNVPEKRYILSFFRLDGGSIVAVRAVV